MFTKDKWEPVGKNQIWDYAKDASLQGTYFYGVYLGKEESIGENKSTIYNFVRYADEDFSKRMGPWSVWGNSLLDIRFKNFARGEQVAIQYLGKVDSEKRKGKQYHNFEVFHKAPEQKIKLNEGWKEIDDDFEEDINKIPF